ncbi:MAG: cytochrome c oxidase subunit II [Armatimonadetes bacterium]|nr:cytochrome c oxidase subunit II [Armatimonadota bacterium]
MPFLGSVIPTFDPVSPQARSILDLTWVTVAILAVILAIVCGAVIVILLRFRGKPGDADPPAVHGHTKLEITWTAIPFAIVTLLFVLSLRTMGQIHPAAAPNQAPDVIVVGHQWWWEVRYPASGVITANEIHLPVGKDALIRLESADVIHDFWVPQLGPKQDAVPGHPNFLWLQPTAPGIYDGACAEFCGNAHAWMRLRVIAETPETFAAWTAAQARPPASQHTEQILKGGAIFQEQACVNCHRVAGMSDTANAAPDLTYVATRQTIGAGVMENSPENLARWLENPQAIKPQCNMPDFNLSEEEVAALVTFLWSLPNPTPPQGSLDHE